MGVGYSVIEEPDIKKNNKKVTPEARQRHVFGEEKPGFIANRFAVIHWSVSSMQVETRLAHVAESSRRLVRYS